MLVVEQSTVVHCGGAGPQQRGASLSDRMQLSRQRISAVAATLLLQAISQCNGDRAGHGLARETGELASEPAGLVVLDVEAHRMPLGVR